MRDYNTPPSRETQPGNWQVDWILEERRRAATKLEEGKRAAAKIQADWLAKLMEWGVMPRL